MAVAVPHHRDHAPRHLRLDPQQLHLVVAGGEGEQRPERHTESRGNETLHRAVVVGAEAVLDLEPVGCQRRLGGDGARARAGADQRQVTEVGKRRGATLRQGVIGRDSEHVGVAHQAQRLERAIGERRAAEGEIEIAALDGRIQIRVGRRLGQPELDAGPFGQEAAHHAGEHPRADALVRRDPQRACLAGVQSGHVRTRGVEPRRDRLRVPQQKLARLGEGDGARTARPVDEALADDALQRGYLLAHGRLRVPEALCGATERPFRRHRLQRRQMPELDAEPAVAGGLLRLAVSIRLSDRCHEYLDLS